MYCFSSRCRKCGLELETPFASGVGVYTGVDMLVAVAVGEFERTGTTTTLGVLVRMGVVTAVGVFVGTGITTTLKD